MNHGNLHWTKPFYNSKDVTFIFNLNLIEANYNEIKRWNIPYRDATKREEKANSSRRLNLNRMSLFK